MYIYTGAETAPLSVSGKILMGGWWFVCLILGAAYTAELTVLFAAEDNKIDIPGSINELISKIPPDIPFGARNNSHTTEYLRHSPIPQYREAYQYMKMEGLLYETRDEALAAVLHDNIAIITDSPFIDFLVSRKGDYNPDCTLTSIGDGQFSPGGYGLGLTKNSPFTDDFSLAILELRRMGVIERLTNEYFNYQRTCTSTINTSASVNMDTEQIDLKAFGGLFIILGIAVVISPTVLLLEHTFKHRHSIKTMLAKKFYTSHAKEEKEETLEEEALEEEEISALSNSHQELRTSTQL